MSSTTFTEITEPFLRFARSQRPQIDEALERLTHYDGDCPDVLREAIRYSLLAPGKRLRPILVLMAAESCGSDPRRAMPAACAVEMIHAYSLVHDDLPSMDDDRLRRGRPTCHVRYGESLAILVGDALLAQAFEVLSAGITPPARALACCRQLASAAGPCSLVGGQVDDLRASSMAMGPAELERIHRRKTGALFRASLQLGGIVAGASPSEQEALTSYGEHVGLAFQILDDLLDIWGNPTSLGKSAGKDAAQGKPTYPALLGEAASAGRAEQLLAEARGAVDGLKHAERLCALTWYVLQRDH